MTNFHKNLVNLSKKYGSINDKNDVMDQFFKRELIMTHPINQFIHCVANKIKIEDTNFNPLLKEIKSKKDSEFLNGLKNLCAQIPDDRALLCNEQFISDTLKLSTKLVKKITLMQSKEQGVAAFNKIVEIVRRIVFKNWHCGHRPLNKVFKTESLALWKSQIDYTILDNRGKLFVDCNHILYVTSPKSTEDLEDFIKEIQSKLTEKISHIQFQNCQIMARENAEKFLENPFLAKLFFYPKIYQFSDKQKEFKISPQFLLKCPFLQNLSIHLQSMNKYPYIDFSNMDFDTFQLINNFFENPNSLILNEENIGKITEAAHFLQCFDLLKLCETFLLEHTDSNPSLLKWFYSGISVDLPLFRVVAKRKINEIIKKCAKFEELIEFLKELANAPVKSLNLSSLSFLKDEDLEQIITLFPDLENLNLNHCENLTEKIGPIFMQLKQLTSLSLAECQGISNFKELFEILKNLAKSPIKSFNLGSLSFLKDEDIEQIITLFPDLENLNLNHCENLTDKIGPILENLKLLRCLNLERCHNITESIKANFKTHANLKIWMPNYEKDFLFNLIDLFHKKIKISDSHFTLIELFNHLNKNKKNY